MFTFFRRPSREQRATLAQIHPTRWTLSIDGLVDAWKGSHHYVIRSDGSFFQYR